MHPLRAIRARHHISISALTEAAGLSERRISGIERGTRETDEGELQQIADALTDLARDDYFDSSPPEYAAEDLMYDSDECVVDECRNTQDRMDNICSRCKRFEANPPPEPNWSKVPIEPRPGWRDQAACGDMDREWFYPDKGEQISPDVILACNVRCPVRYDCLSYGMNLVGENRGGVLDAEKYGVWGGINAAGRGPSTMRAHREDVAA